MKQLLLLFLFSLAVPCLAQRAGGAGTSAVVLPPTQLPYSCSEAISRAQHTTDSLLAALDKTQIPTQVLYDRVFGLAALDVFNRVYSDPDTSSVQHYLQSYYELHVANYNNTGAEPCRQVLADNAQYYQQQGTVLIGALRYRFNYIDSNAVRNNQLRWDTSAPSKLFDVPGRSGSPYLLAEVAVAAALADSSLSDAVSFRLDPASTFTNTGATLNSIIIDFGDGNAARTVTPGQVVQVNYGTAGQKILRYVLSYSDGSQFTTYSRLYVPAAVVSCATCRPTCISNGDPCYTPAALFEADIPYQGIKGKAELSYYYSSAKTAAIVRNLSLNRSSSLTA